MCIHTSSAPLGLCYVHLEHGSLIFLSEEMGINVYPRNTVAWNMRYKSNSYPQTIPKPHFQHVSCDQEFYTVYQKKTQQNSIAAIAPPPRTLWTQCWATPEAPVESGRASPLASPCPPGCSAVAPHSDSPRRRVGQNAQDRHLQNEKSWDFGLLLKICLRSFKTKQFGSFGSQISYSNTCACSHFHSSLPLLQSGFEVRLVSNHNNHVPKADSTHPASFSRVGVDQPPQKKMPMLEKTFLFKSFPAWASANSGLSFPCCSIAFCISSANLPNAASSKSLPPAATGAAGAGVAAGALKLFRLLIEKAPASAGAGGMVRYS